MKRIRHLVLLVSFVGALGCASASDDLIADVRAAIARSDFAEGERLVSAHRAARGVTPEMLAALSWLGRGTLAAGQLAEADAYAQQTYDLVVAELKNRGVDDEPHLPIALGASIEVLAQSAARRGARTEAVSFLQRELETYRETSIHMRLQKNIHLLSLEGSPAPPLDATEPLGEPLPSLDELRGRVVLMFFWAHWCSDCKTQLPVIVHLVDRYGDQGLSVVAPTQRYGYLAGGATAAPDEEARYIGQVWETAYGTLNGVPAALDESNHQRYGVSSTPTIVLVDRDGIVRLYHPGQMTEEALEPIVRRWVAGD